MFTIQGLNADGRVITITGEVVVWQPANNRAVLFVRGEYVEVFYPEVQD